MQAEPSGPPPDAAFSSATSGPALSLLADALPWPLMVLRADGRLLHANRPARRLLQEDRCLTLQRDGQLLLWPERRQAEWRAALRAVSAASRPSLLRWPGPGLGHSATLMPLGETDQELLLALSAPGGALAQARVFAQLHGLSPSETRVLLQLAQGETPASAAAALGVTVATVRSQLLRLRRKSTQPSLVELLRAVHRMPPLPAAHAGLERRCE